MTSEKSAGGKTITPEEMEQVLDEVWDVVKGGVSLFRKQK